MYLFHIFSPYLRHTLFVYLLRLHETTTDWSNFPVHNNVIIVFQTIELATWLNFFVSLTTSENTQKKF